MSFGFGKIFWKLHFSLLNGIACKLSFNWTNQWTLELKCLFWNEQSVLSSTSWTSAIRMQQALQCFAKQQIWFKCKCEFHTENQFSWIHNCSKYCKQEVPISQFQNQCHNCHFALVMFCNFSCEGIDCRKFAEVVFNWCNHHGKKQQTLAMQHSLGCETNCSWHPKNEKHFVKFFLHVLKKSSLSIELFLALQLSSCANLLISSHYLFERQLTGSLKHSNNSKFFEALCQWLATLQLWKWAWAHDANNAETKGKWELQWTEDKHTTT